MASRRPVIETWLAADRHKPDCWRVEHIGRRAAGAALASEPKPSDALAKCLARLRERPGPSHYRIAPVCEAG
jgi:hypothetical protein